MTARVLMIGFPILINHCICQSLRSTDHLGNTIMELHPNCAPHATFNYALTNETKKDSCKCVIHVYHMSALGRKAGKTFNDNCRLHGPVRLPIDRTVMK